jgi:hydrogenase maturation protein HypF
MNPPPTDSVPLRRLAISVRGVVQGVGFRPFVFNSARAEGLAGWVQNSADVVRIEVEGEAAALDAFLTTLRHRCPPQARIDALDVQEVALANDEPGAEGFQIRTSTDSAAPRPTIPADLATCRQCLAEIQDPAERRYQYPFTNCTNCGPRWSIIRQLPYDRSRTSMADFAMCSDCRAEYDSPSDRRFHAQPIACPRCGPALQLLDAAGREVASKHDAFRMAVEAIRAGRIVALKGLGGFQLVADATNAEVVLRLRSRKHRPDRPFALMFPSLDEVRKHCEVSDEEARALASPEAPIVLLRRVGCAHHELGPIAMLPVGEARPTAEAVAPGNPYLGAMLPYTPLHHLLMAALDRPVVCTSGNLSEEPMATTTEEAVRRLGGIADLLLTHNRPIVRPVDDSVARIGPDGMQVLRRARGFAPLPLQLGLSAPTILAVGGHLKNTVALALRRVGCAHHEPATTGELPVGGAHPTGSPVGNAHPTPVVLSSHIGDLDSPLGVEVLRRAIDDLVEFFQAAPEMVACDLHPDYASTRHAEALAARWDVPLVRVQHHHAHVAACMAEHSLEGPVLGLSWDGTGYGTDGTVWGGEALLCQSDAFVRVAHLRTFPLPGGDRAVREPRRSALGVLYAIDCVGWAPPTGSLFRPEELRTLMALLARGRSVPRTSSMGRLFDAVAALCGLPSVISFEGQAAMALEYAADWTVEESYPLPLVTCGEGDCPDFCASTGETKMGLSPLRDAPSPAVADWEPLVRAVLADRATGEPVGRISARFHNALADLAVAIARHTAAATKAVVLTGGCFQNLLLQDRVRQRLLETGFSVYTHQRVPPGDGGIALGQIFVAASSISNQQRK